MEAIRVGFRSARGSGIAGLAKHLRLPGSSVAQLPLRNALRAPRRTLLTVLGIGAVLSVLIAFLGLIDSFDATVDRSEAEIAGQEPEPRRSSPWTASTAPPRRGAQSSRPPASKLPNRS